MNTNDTTTLYVSAIDLDGYNDAQRALIEEHRSEYSDRNTFADLTADYAEEIDALADEN